mmetsp:Transcript_8200/g.11631  ORF Transcript_8200/g.11631 Transcript_8200/m.11631 type:complete len:95 (-) Transcript_8200:257-541(-)
MPVLVKFTASWCKPCKRIAPKFEALSKEHKNSLIFLEVDFDSNQKLAKHLGAGLLPTFQLYRRLKKVSDFVGPYEDQLQEMILNAGNRILQTTN